MRREVVKPGAFKSTLSFFLSLSLSLSLYLSLSLVKTLFYLAIVRLKSMLYEWIFTELYTSNTLLKWNAKSPMSHYEIEYDAKT